MELTPKEKAKELVNKYLQIYDGRVIQAKQCALIAVDEILKEISPLDYHPLGSYINSKLEYYQEVKKEIKKL